MFFLLASLTYEDLKKSEKLKLSNMKADNKDFVKRILAKEQNIFNQLIFLLVIYIEFPLMLCLVIFGLREIIYLYNVILLFFFVFYMLSPKLFNKCILMLMLFANVFVLENYIFTLVWDYDNGEAPIWVRACGFAPLD